MSVVAALVAAGGLAWPGWLTGGTGLSPAAAADAPTSATIVIPKNARSVGYQNPQVSMAQGGQLNVVSHDSITHSVTSDDVDASGNHLFTVDVPPGATKQIPAASNLPPGSYGFYCRFHPSMRGTLTISSSSGGGGGGGGGTGVSFDQPLVIPPVLTGSKLRIPMERSYVQVLPTGPKTRMWTFGGTYPGPVIERPAGHDTKVTFVNKLPKRFGAFTVHLHGDHHTSPNDGLPTRHLIAHGHSRTYDYPLVDNGKPERASDFWYHDHRMDRTTRDNWMGLQGMFIVHDQREQSLPLPHGKFDVPLMVSERSFTSDNQLTHPFPKHPQMITTGADAPPNDATIGDHILVNGRFAPYLKVSTHRYRLRLFNASAFTSYDFHMSDGQPLVQVGSGSGLLRSPITRSDILLGPAERADVIVDFHKEYGKRVVLESIPRANAPADGAGSPTASIMQFRVNRHASSDHTSIPDRLVSQPHIDVPRKVSKVWRFDVAGDSTNGAYWTVNGKPFDPKRVDYKVRLGSTQVWKLVNDSPVTHFIHIHEEQWHTISRDGKRPPPWERGLIDMWKLDPGESVKVAAHFTDYTGVFMLHCHMLDHEDHGLMAQFQVVGPRASTAVVRGGNYVYGGSVAPLLSGARPWTWAPSWLCEPPPRRT